VPPRPEVLAQLARLLSDEELRSAENDAVHAAVDKKFWSLVEGLLGEAAVSDDVSDRASAEAYLESRVEFLGEVLGAEQRSLLRETLIRGVSSW
jgi:hypothetical protein